MHTHIYINTQEDMDNIVSAVIHLANKDYSSHTHMHTYIHTCIHTYIHTQEDMDNIVSAVIHLANKDYTSLVNDFINLNILPRDCDRAKVCVYTCAYVCTNACRYEKFVFWRLVSYKYFTHCNVLSQDCHRGNVGLVCVQMHNMCMHTKCLDTSGKFR
jgi:hypothetical protein